MNILSHSGPGNRPLWEKICVYSSSVEPSQHCWHSPSWSSVQLNKHCTLLSLACVQGVLYPCHENQGRLWKSPTYTIGEIIIIPRVLAGRETHPLQGNKSSVWTEARFAGRVISGSWVSCRGQESNKAKGYLFALAMMESIDNGWLLVPCITGWQQVKASLIIKDVVPLCKQKSHSNNTVVSYSDIML